MPLICPPGQHVEEICVADAPPPPPAPREWRDLGAVPKIAGMPTALGRTIRGVHPYDGAVWLGYGDWGSNTGPIDLIAHDGAGFVTKFSPFWTEASYVFRTVGDRFYAVGHDPRMAGTPNPTNQGPDFVVCTGADCRVVDDKIVFAVHLFDLCQWGGALWLAGVHGAAAAIYVSRDDGATWTLSGMQSAAGEPASRYYVLVPHESGLYVQRQGFNGRSMVARVTRDGRTWQDAPIDLFRQGGGGGWKHWTLADGSTVYLDRPPVGGFVNLYRFDGLTARVTRASIYDAWGDGSAVYALVADQARSVVRSTNGVDWDVVTTGAPVTGRSLCVDPGGAIYIGTSDSRLWRWGAV